MDFFLFFVNFIYFLFIYFLAASGVSCGTWDLLLGHVGFSLVAALRLLSSCGIWDLSLQRLGSSLQHAGFSLVAVRGLQSARA